MPPENLGKVFLDTRALFAAVLSPPGGARMLSRLGEGGRLQLLVGPTVFQEMKNVVQRSVPATWPRVRRLMATAKMVFGPAPAEEQLAFARASVSYPPDAVVLTEALASGAHRFVTHVKRHFLPLKCARLVRPVKRWPGCANGYSPVGC